MSIRPLIILLLLTAGYAASAQHAVPGKDTVLKGSTIEVIQSYKPQVKQAPKPEWIPQLPPADTTHPTFNYDVPQQTLYYTYSSMPLRPLAMGKELIKLPFENYVKLGGGNLSTLYLDAGIGGIHGKNYETGLHLHYLSQQGSISDQQTSLAGVEAEGIFHGPKTDWHVAAEGERNQYNYYGYNHDVYKYGNDSVQQTYTKVGVGLDLKNGVGNTSKFRYDGGISGSLYTAALGVSEMNIGLNLPFEYRFDSTVQALVTIKGDDAHLATKDSSRDNTLAGILPGIRIHTGVFTGSAIVGFTFGAGSKQYILPDINLAVKIPNSTTTISAGLQLSVNQNTYEQLTAENPYMASYYQLIQTRKDEYYGAVQGGAGDHFTYSARVSYWNFQGLPTYLSDFGDGRKFDVVYDTANAISFQLGARYTVANKWSAGLSGAFYSFSSGTQQYVWQEPSTRIKGDYSATVLTKLHVSVYLSFLGGIYAKDVNHNAIALNPVFDIGGNAEYQIVKRLSAFVQINNLLNNTYQRWYGYEAYGLNIYGGLRLKF